MPVTEMTVKEYAGVRGISDGAVRRAIKFGYALPGVVKMKKFGWAWSLIVDIKKLPKKK